MFLQRIHIILKWNNKQDSWCLAYISSHQINVEDNNITDMCNEGYVEKVGSSNPVYPMAFLITV